ncbi:MAG: Hint domain-containing protein, partial [Paracoccus sp. (in: a-proteobacteria)]
MTKSSSSLPYPGNQPVQGSVGTNVVSDQAGTIFAGNSFLSQSSTAVGAVLTQYPVGTAGNLATTKGWGWDWGSGSGSSSTPDGYVDGTEYNDFIGDYYVDADCDSIDGNDAILPGASGDEDHIRAGAGHDTVYGGRGADTVLGGGGNDKLYGYGECEDDGASDLLKGGAGCDDIFGGGGDDTLYGGDDYDLLFGGQGNDYLDGEGDRDELTGGAGFDTFVAGDQDTITDFNTAFGQNIHNDDQSDNDFVDLSGYYNTTNLAEINTDRVAAGLAPYDNPLEWLRADQDDDGVLNDLADKGLTLTIQKDCLPVCGDDLTWDNTNVPCFSTDTLIRTASGEVRAGDLDVGMLVVTRDAGLQPVRWIGQRRLDANALWTTPKLRPIRICKGA